MAQKDFERPFKLANIQVALSDVPFGENFVVSIKLIGTYAISVIG